jgi:hypothetical protein
VTVPVIASAASAPSIISSTAFGTAMPPRFWRRPYSFRRVFDQEAKTYMAGAGLSMRLDA